LFFGGREVAWLLYVRIWQADHQEPKSHIVLCEFLSGYTALPLT
jgi:hypothetical protein